MNVKIIDFGLLTKHYKKYQEGVQRIEKEKKEFLVEIKPLQDKINFIVKNNGKQEELIFITEQIKSLEIKLKINIKTISDDVNNNCYQEISEVVSKWAIFNNISLVLSSSEVVFNKKEFESTNEILELFKQNNLFI